jgi:hypothetical protein
LAVKVKQPAHGPAQAGVALVIVSAFAVLRQVQSDAFIFFADAQAEEAIS